MMLLLHKLKGLYLQHYLNTNLRRLPLIEPPPILLYLWINNYNSPHLLIVIPLL